MNDDDRCLKIITNSLNIYPYFVVNEDIFHLKMYFYCEHFKRILYDFLWFCFSLIIQHLNDYDCYAMITMMIASVKRN